MTLCIVSQESATLQSPLRALQALGFSLHPRASPGFAQRTATLGPGTYTMIDRGALDVVYFCTMVDSNRSDNSRLAETRRLQQLTGFYILLSRANETINLASDESSLLHNLCHLAISHTPLHLAWIGKPGADQWVQTLAAAGATDYLQDLRVSVDALRPEGLGPVGRCWREQTPIFDDTLIEHPALPHWAERFERFGLGGIAALPIRRNDTTWAVLTVYQRKGHVFDHDLRSILTDLALDIGFGLDRLDMLREERKASKLNEALLDNLAAGINVMRYPERVIERVNQRMLEIYGAASAQEMLGRHPKDFYADEETFYQVTELAMTVIATGSGSLRDVRYRRLDNAEIIYVDLSGRRLDQGDGVLRIVWTHVDVTERHEREQLIRSLNRQRTTLLDNTVVGIDLVQYPERVFVEVNQGFLNIMGYEHAEEIVGRTTADIYPNPGEDQRMAQPSQQILQQGQGALRDLAIRRRDEQLIYLDLSWRLVDDVDPVHPIIVWTSVDVTERHHLAQELEYQALYDSLTGLPNRRALELEITKAMARSDRSQKLLAVVVIDLDGFKLINDTWGHAAGDQVLIQVAQRIKSGMRSTDFVSRMGGDEFILLLEDCANLEEVKRVLVKIRELVQIPMALEPLQKLQTDLSAGVSFYPPADPMHRTPDALIRLADQALYASKSRKESRQNYWAMLGAPETPAQG